MTVSACILGCAGPTLSKAEKAFFAAVRPWGFILFGRNIDTPDQVRALTDDLRTCVGREQAPILIDQEGGRVQRMGRPHWRRYPPSRAYGQLGADGREIARLGGRLIAHDLAVMGVTVNCAPVLDLPSPDGHAIISDRAYGDTPTDAVVLGRAMAEGLIAGGVLPVVKHIPGHGRARVDSHEALPVVDAAWDELEAWDFAPFRALSDMPMAMTAHVIYAAADPKRPATTSKTVIQKGIRGAIGFDGLLMSDDLSMKALAGGFRGRAERALKAGCDVVLHCNGDMAEMKAVAAGTGSLKGRAKRRAEAALARRPRAAEPFDPAEARLRFDAAFDGRFAA